jgi:hypothetical protein
MSSSSAHSQKPRHAINAALKNCSAPPVSFAAEDGVSVPLLGGSVQGPDEQPLIPLTHKPDIFLAMFASLWMAWSLCIILLWIGTRSIFGPVEDALIKLLNLLLEPPGD